MVVTYTVAENQKPTPEQLSRIREAAKRPIVFDEDCPEMTDEQLRQFRPVHPEAWERRERPDGCEAQSHAERRV